MRNKCLKSFILLFAVFMTVSCSGLLTPKNSKLEKGTIRITLPETNARTEGSKDDVDYYLISIVSEASGTITVSSGKYTGGTFQTKVLPGAYSVIVQGIDEDDSRYGDIKLPLFMGRTNGVTVTADKESTAQIKMKLFELHASGTTYLQARDVANFDWGSGKLPELPYPFDGWYTDRSCTTQITEFPATDDEFFASPYLNFNNYLTYKLHDTVEIMEPGTDGSAGTDATYVLFGDFPQSKLTGQSADFTFDKKPSYNGWYVGSDGNYYAKVEDAYFLVEPIKWRVLDTNYTVGRGKTSCLLFAEDILATGVPFYEFSHGEMADANNYEYSQIRAYLNGTRYFAYKGEGYEDGNDDLWLNKGFLQTAFTEAARKTIVTTTVNNVAEECNDTSDKVFMLSYNEATNVNYGFQANPYEDDSTRSRTATDYVTSLANAVGDPMWGPYEVTDYWLRSHSNMGSAYSDETYTVNGALNGRGRVYTDTTGVVPALCIDVPGLTSQSRVIYASADGTGDGTTRSSPKNVNDALSALNDSYEDEDYIIPTIYLVNDVMISNIIKASVNILGAGGNSGTESVTIFTSDSSPVTFSSSSYSTLKNVTIEITENEHTNCGILNEGTLFIEDCCINAGYEGALKNTGDCYLNFCTVNVGDEYGVSTESGNLFINNTKIQGTETITGYGISCTSAMTVNNTTITGCNTGTNYGGGVYIESRSDCTITNSTISDCSAACGGAIYHSYSGDFTGGKLVLQDCIITGCTSLKNIGDEDSGNGGGIYNSGGSLQLIDCSITDCSSNGGNGGGIYTTEYVYIYNSTISNCSNQNGGDGASIYCTKIDDSEPSVNYHAKGDTFYINSDITPDTDFDNEDLLMTPSN